MPKCLRLCRKVIHQVLQFLQTSFQGLVNVGDAVMARLVAHVVRSPDVRVDPEDDLPSEGEALDQFHPRRLGIIPSIDGLRLIRDPEQDDIGVLQRGRFPIDLRPPLHPSLAPVRIQERDTVDTEALCEFRHGSLPFGRAFHRSGQEYGQTGLFRKGSGGFDDGVHK